MEKEFSPKMHFYYLYAVCVRTHYLNLSDALGTYA